MLTPLSGLAPIVNDTAKVLILGSMPGNMSLAKQQYYAHPRNAFWPIMAQLAEINLALPYADRVQQLQAKGYALWDVLAACQRQGSLDSAIRNADANDFARFLAAHNQVDCIAFNGAKASQLFKKLVLPALTLPPPLLTLPSTSPAHAAMSFSQKLSAWQQIKLPRHLHS